MAIIRFGVLLVIGLSASTGSHAQSLGGISVGEPASSAMETLRALGKVVRIPLKLEAYTAGDYGLTLCEGRVWGISRNANSNFESFARMGSVARAKYGKISDAEIMSQEGSTYAGGVTVKWRLAAGYTYAITYITTSVGSSTAEGFTRTVLCK